MAHELHAATVMPAMMSWMMFMGGRWILERLGLYGLGCCLIFLYRYRQGYAEWQCSIPGSDWQVEGGKRDEAWRSAFSLLYLVDLDIMQARRLSF